MPEAFAAMTNPAAAPRAGLLSHRFVSPRTLGASELTEIWRFYSQFVHREREPFLEKLRATEEVFLGRDAQGTLRSFGAVQSYTVTWEGRSFGLLYTGWTAIDPAYRGRDVVQWAGLRCYLKYRARRPTDPVYWLFWASTYKGYLLMVRNFRDCWPRRDVPWPAREAGLVAQVMEQMGATGWDRERGIVRRFGASRYLDGSYANEPDALRDPHVRYYAQLNPDQHLGDSVVCLASLSLRNWARVLRRTLSRRLRGSRHRRRATGE